MTTVTLRPDGTNVSAGTVTGAASRHAATSDDSSSTYITLPDSTATYVELSLGTSSIPAGAMLKTARAWADGGGVTGGTRGGIYLYGPTGSALASYTGTVADEDDDEQIFTSAALDSLEGQTLVDGLRISFATFSNSYEDLRIYEAGVDLTYVAQPTVAVTAVSPDPTAQTSPTIEWAATLDSDGGPQVGYRVNVFSAAQYGAGGFDPETSASVYSSGGLTGAASSLTVGPLPDDTTYRAYVRVYQEVNGSSHLSDWSYVQFAVDADTADVSTVAAVADDAAGKIALTVTRDGASEAWEYVEVERSVDAGVTWVPVRFATFVDATGNATTFTVDDHEAPNNQAVVYRARATYYDTGLPITGDWTESSSVSWSSDDEWLKVPNDPTLNVTVAGATYAPEQRSTRAGVFQVDGAVYPVVVTDVLSSPSGSITFRAKGKTALQGILSALEAGGPFLLNLKPDSLIGPNFDGFQYVAVTDSSIAWQTQFYRENDTEIRMAALSIVAVSRPPDATAGAA